MDKTPEQQAEELLPWEVFSCETADETAWEKIIAAVAAALAPKDDLVAEIERLKLEWSGMKSEVQVCHQQIAELRSQLAVATEYVKAAEAWLNHNDPPNMQELMGKWQAVRHKLDFQQWIAQAERKE